MGKLVKISAALVAAMACFFAFVGCDDPATEPTNNGNAGTIEAYDRNEWQIEGSTVVKYLGNATDVTIPNGVEFIWDKAFFGCSLASITIPASVISISNSAFFRGSLGTVNYGGTLAQWCTMNSGGISYAKSVKLADGTDLKSLTNVTISAGVTSIGDYAFFYCESLTRVTIPAGVTSIGDSVFSCCKGLTSITIPDGVTSIGSSAFENCSNLTSVTIPVSVKESIGSNAFDGDYNLKTVNYSGTLAQWCTMEGDYSLMRWAKSIKLSDGTDLKSVTSLDIPVGVTRIGGFAFTYCRDLISVTIPDSVTSIGRCAFECCSGLRDITIPDGVTSIEEYAFCDCRLTSITIPVSMKRILYCAFCDCYNLTNVQYGGTESDWKKIERGDDEDDDGLRGKTITGSDGSTWVAE